MVSNIIDILQKRAIQTPDSTAYVFLKDGKTHDDCLSYQQLEEKVKAIASSLQSYATSGSRAMLMYPQGLEFIASFLACLYTGIIAVPVPAPEALRLKRVLPRLQSIAIDSQSSLILTTSKLAPQVEKICARVSQLQSITILTTDTICLKDPSDISNNASQERLAYLQYTSGSTSSPKGVMISHRNLIANLDAITQAVYTHVRDSKSASWTPYFHDYGLVKGLLQPLYMGIPSYVISPVTFIKRPVRWLEAISQYGITHSGAPNFAYDYCVSEIKPKHLDDLDLSTWRVAHSGAEPIRPSTLEAFSQKFEPYGFSHECFYPSYGLAEATLMVTTKKKGESLLFLDASTQELAKNKVVQVSKESGKEKKQRLVSCGSTHRDTKVVIVDPQTLEQCEDHQIGEIWVAGESVAQGYWRDPSETQRNFSASLSNLSQDKFLRTGDLGFLSGEELFVTGRIKDLIVIRGQNYYPQDIELTAQQSHTALVENGCAAFSVESHGKEVVVVVQEVTKKYQNQADFEDVIAAIRRAVITTHELQIHGLVLVKRGTVPKTSSGKVMRQACRQQFLEQKLSQVLASQSRGLEQTFT